MKSKNVVNLLLCGIYILWLLCYITVYTGNMHTIQILIPCKLSLQFVNSRKFKEKNPEDIVANCNLQMCKFYAV